MKVLKTITASLCIFLCTAAAVTAESSLESTFSGYGIKNIGIYTEAYEDLRSDNFLAEVLAMKSNPILSDPSFYRNQYCNFDRITPPLTTPGYPLSGKTKSIIDDTLDEGLSAYLDELGWVSEIISDFAEGSLTDMLSQAQNKNIDAVMVVRYTPVNYFIPVENYSEDWLSGSSGLTTGALQFGIGLIPAIELYDTRTGNRIWYSAYHTGHQVISKKQPYLSYVDKAGDFFIEMDLDDNEKKAAWAAAEMKGDMDSFFSVYDADEKAVETMIKLTMADAAQPFPRASDFGERSTSLTANSLQHIFWSDYPSYSLYGTELGLGYRFDYVGNFNLYYRDNSYGSSDNDPSQIIETSGAMMHRLDIPFYSIATGNISVEPNLFVGYIPPYSSTITYNDLGYDELTNEAHIISTETESAVISALSIGFDLTLKYYLRVNEKFSFFIGAQGAAQTYITDAASSAEDPIQDRGQFRDHGEGLFFIEGPDLTITAAVIAGVRLDMKQPVEIFAMYCPVGQAGDLTSPTISAGIRWLPLTWGWVEPHQSYVAEDLSIF